MRSLAQEASQRVCIIQVLAKDVEKEKKVCKMRWQNFLKGLQDIVPTQGLNSIHSVSLSVDILCRCWLNVPIFASVTLHVSTQNINGLFFLKQGSFVIVRNTKWTYIGEVLDLYSGNRYGSVKTAGTVSELQYLSVRVYLPLVSVCCCSPISHM